MGLKAFRANKSDKVPRFECGNCHCKRYSQCGCKKGSVKNDKVENAKS